MQIFKYTKPNKLRTSNTDEVLHFYFASFCVINLREKKTEIQFNGIGDNIQLNSEKNNQTEFHRDDSSYSIAWPNS